MTSVQITFLGTGAGNCIHRAHTAIVLDWSNGTRLLLDAGSGNSVLRPGVAVNMLAQDFHKVLLSHHHADHMAGLPHIQGQCALVDPEGPAMEVWHRGLCQLFQLQYLFQLQCQLSVTANYFSYNATASITVQLFQLQYATKVAAPT